MSPPVDQGRANNTLRVDAGLLGRSCGPRSRLQPRAAAARYLRAARSSAGSPVGAGPRAGLCRRTHRSRASGWSCRERVQVRQSGPRRPRSRARSPSSTGTAISISAIRRITHPAGRESLPLVSTRDGAAAPPHAVRSKRPGDRPAVIHPHPSSSEWAVEIGRIGPYLVDWKARSRVRGFRPRVYRRGKSHVCCALHLLTWSVCCPHGAASSIPLSFACGAGVSASHTNPIFF